MWAHCTTKDFVHYRDYGPVLFPDQDFDAHGVYSGSALVENDTIYFYYTGNVKYFDRDDYDYVNSGRGSNTAMFTSKDGYEFSSKELLMTTDDYPADMSNHVRDPKILKHDDAYYMVLGARDRKDFGMILLYRSEDLKHWEYFDRITTEEPFGYMWECPDLFEIDGQLILTCCPQGVKAQGFDYHNPHQSVAMKLDYDFETKESKIEDVKLMDRGFDFYAQQTFEDEQGRRILIGWMGVPDPEYTNPTVEDGWQHALTIPRQVSLRDGKFIQEPIEELKKLRCGETKMTFDEAEKKPLDDVVYEAIVEYNKCKDMTMTLREGITLSYKDKILTLDLGEYGAGRTTRKVRVESLEYLQIFADTSSIEIFVNHGEEVFTSRIYSLKGNVSIQGELEVTMTVYPLKSFLIEGGCNEE